MPDGIAADYSLKPSELAETPRRARRSPSSNSSPPEMLLRTFFR